MPPDVSKFEFSNIFPDNISKKMMLGLVEQVGVQGAYNLIPFASESHSLTAVKATLGGKDVPRGRMRLTLRRPMAQTYTTVPSRC